MFSAISFLCLTVVCVQTTSGVCIRDSIKADVIADPTADAGSANGPTLPNDLGFEPGLIAAVSNGGRFTVTSTSSIPSSGVIVQSDNLIIEGPLTVTGQLPFLGVVAMDGVLPVEGSGTVQYGCGNGNVGILREGVEASVVPTYNGLIYNGQNNGLGYRPVY